VRPSAARPERSPTRLTDVGIDDTFITRAGGDHPRHVGAVRAHLRRCPRPGAEAFAGERAELLFTNLFQEQEDALREAFADQVS
jgi:uncharacterized membrane protein